MERACRLSNTVHWEVTPSLPLPLLPASCGARGQRLLLFEEHESAGSRPVDRIEIIGHATRIADLLRECDVSYLNLKEEETSFSHYTECPRLYTEVLKYNPEAFEFSIPGSVKEKRLVPERKLFEQHGNSIVPEQRSREDVYNSQLERKLANETTSSSSSRKPKVKKKEAESSTLPSPEVSDHQGIIAGFCEMVDDFCAKAEFLSADQELSAEGVSLPLADIKILVNGILPMREKGILHLVPVETIIRLLNVLDHQIQCGQGVSVDETENPAADAVPLVVSALESTYAALALMTHHSMPKQLYKEEIIERILDFSRHGIMEVMAAFDPSYHALHRPSENGAADGNEVEEDDADIGSAGKKRRNMRSVKVKKPTGNKVSAAVHTILQKLCSILGLLKDLLVVEKLSDICILQLVKTSFSTFLVDNIQILQLKAIALICGVFGSYTQHRHFVIDETLQLLRKLPCLKRALRTYLLPDEEQKQIQMITALLIQLVQYTANLPETLKSKLTYNSIHDISIDMDYPTKCNEAATEACCLFWTNVLQRITTAKAQEASESKMILENLVMDLLTTLNLPEYPASALILEVLCVLLLQNAGLKSKDISARCMAVDLLGTVAARLKRDAVVYRGDKFWIIQELVDGNDEDGSNTKDICHICLKGKGGKTVIVCHMCQRCFHVECLGVARREILFRDWSCHVCLCNKQLTILQSFCKSPREKDGKGSVGSSEATYSISRLEVIQQILLNYLQENASADDVHFFTRWFYLCLWYKDDPHCEKKIIYYLGRVKSKAILRDFGSSLTLSRDSVKRISIALGQNSSFSRGFDKILSLLLASLRENSPVLRAKALRAVSAIVEADPEVLCDKRVQCAVEGRFCDSAISVREAALELVGRHIASHPDVALKYFEKVAERIKDTGVSVRKRAIKIIRDMCLSNDSFLESTHAFLEILARVSDEESSIQDLVCKTFYEFWFEEPSGTQTQFVNDGSCVPLELARKTEQIVNLLRRMPNHNLLVTVIKRTLALDFFSQSAKASGVNTVLLTQVRKRCELMCKHLLERILQLEETNTTEEEVVIFPYVLALQAFCIVDPSLCSPATDPAQFVATLEPYLKNQVDTRPVAQLLENIIFIIDSVMPLLRKPPASVVEELEQDLKRMIVRHSFLTVVHACIRCLCSLCKIAGKGAGLVEYLIQVFFKHLHGSAIDNNQLLGRSLFCLGLLIRYGKELMINCDNKHELISKCLSMLKRFLICDDFGMKARSLQALGFVLIAHPEFMLENDIRKIVEASLSSCSDDRLKMQALQNMYDYLLDAESQLGNTGNTKPIQPTQDAGCKVPVAAGAGDTNICGGIIQLYWDKILELCLDLNEQIRQYALKIVEVVLRQGLVHPITCVPYLVALETDPQEANSKLAHHLLMYMNEKYPAFFENRLGDGLHMSFRFVQTMFATPCSDSKGRIDASTFTYVRPGISRIYRLIRGNRLSRNKFMHSIVRKFELGSWSSSPLPFLMYCTEILASLPFTCPDEPLYLVYDINRIVQVRAGPLESNMKMWSSLSHQKDLNEISNGDDEHRRTTEVNHTSSYNLSEQILSTDSYQIPEEILLKCQADCHDAIALQLLLKLKRYLKIVFSLDDARCQAFSLKEYPKAGETLHRQNIPFSISDGLIKLPSSFKDMVEKYQEFKTSLREDTMDYSIYSANVKKRPAPRSSRGKAAQGPEGRGDDDDNDDDWTCGSHRLNFSAQKANGGRITRQRQQLL